MEITNQPNTSTTNSPSSFGAMLLKAREKQQITLDEAAAELFILKRHLQALEQENFESLPQVTFARGFAINYAKYLGLDPHQVAASFDAAYPNELRTTAVGDIESPLRPMGTLQRDGRTKIRFNPLLLIAIVALIALAVFLLRMVTNASEDTPEPVQSIETITAAEQTEGAAIDNAGIAIGSTDTASSAIGASGAAINLDTDSAAANTDNEADASTTAENATLDFWVKANTNISVTDANGQSLMSGQQGRGGYKVSGTPPFRIQIDKVTNVSLNLNQEAVALRQYATNNQASFTLAP